MSPKPCAICSHRTKQIQSSDQRWFAVRIMPYRRLDDVIDGVVITLVDITDTKQLEKVPAQIGLTPESGCAVRR